MKCDECLALLDQYVEGEFDEQTAQPLVAHVSACPGCASAHEALRHEQEIYASYLLDVEASPALWTRLQASIEKEEASNKLRSLTRLKSWVTNALAAPHLNMARTAALVVIIAGVTVGVVRYLRADKADGVRKAQVSGVRVVPPAPEPRRPDLRETSSGGEPDGDRMKGVDSSTVGKKELGDDLRDTTLKAKRSYPGRRDQLTVAMDHQPLPDEVLRQAERQYLTDINLLSRVANRRGRQFSPTALAKLRKTLATIDQTIAETRHYVSQNPSDPVAVQQMMKAYSRKVEVLREMANT